MQIEFSGSRGLFENPPGNPEVVRQWIEVVQRHLVASFDEIRSRLQLSTHHFFCGISQIACGADMLFTRACQVAKPDVPQRIFLPQPIDEYLAAVGSDGPDFTPEQQAEAQKLLASPHIIQQRVVSQSLDRHERFRETSAEIIRVSDVIVCLFGEQVHAKPGGTQELLQRAGALHTPVLEIHIEVQDGQPICRNTWHVPEQYDVRRPAIPEPLDKLSLPNRDGQIPSSAEYCMPLKKLVSTQAKDQQRFFRYSAALIIAAHIVATVFATGALALHGHGDRIIPWLLGVELVLLAVGFVAHSYMDRSKNARIWANARLVAELARSIGAIDPRHLYLAHLFHLSLPHRFRSLLRTLSVLHLRSTCGNCVPWQKHRDKYRQDRVQDQIDYYTKRLGEDHFRQVSCHRLFIWCSMLAIGATFTKLALLILGGATHPTIALWPPWLGVAAIVLPVFAVGGLSWSAALDCEARIETFRETLAFLKRQMEVLPFIDTPAEFDRLVLETETVLLGEVANWFSRRANTGVA